MNNAIFIDTSNLNVLFKVNGKFVLGANYNSCPVKIATDAQALGTSFDVYLSLWPRQQGESEDVVNGMSVGGVPFVVLREEVEAIFRLVEKVPGVGNIYLCNALANFIIQSRVANFESAINYGRRIALITVKNRMLEGLHIYESTEDLYSVRGENFSCYGDLDLIDVDAIKAQYEELTPFNKSILVPLVHLITSYHSPYNLEIDAVKQELGLGEYAGRRKVEAPPKEEPKPVPKREPIKPVYTDEDVEARVEFRKPRLSVLNVLLTLVILAGCAITGLGYSFDKTTSQISQLQSEILPFQDETRVYNELASVYVSSHGMAEYASELLSYAQTNTVGFTVAGMEVNSNSIVIRCNAIDPNAIETFRSHLEMQYIVGEVNNLDTTVGANETVIYNYNVTIVRQ